MPPRHRVRREDEGVRRRDRIQRILTGGGRTGAEELRKVLLSNTDLKYKEFTHKISVPSSEHPVIGIRIPVMKAFAKDVCKGDWKGYLKGIKDVYMEDLMVRGLIINYADMEIGDRLELIKEFVPIMDSWAVCDSFCAAMKINKKNADAYWDLAIPFLNTDEEFQIRFAVAVMIFHFVDDKHIDDIIAYMGKIKNDAYYVRMGVAWCLSDCFIKFPERMMEYLKNNTLDKFTFNKTLSKITDSFRVSDEYKEEIRKMRRK